MNALAKQMNNSIDREDTLAYAVENIGSGTQHPAIAIIEACIKHNIVAFLEGPPGIAKSAIIYQLARRLDINLIEFRPGLEDLSGLKGLPNFHTNEDGTISTKWSIPAHFPTDPTWKGILFLDEFVKAAPSIQGAMSQLILDRRIGDYILPKGVIIVLAGNRSKDRAAVNKMPTDLANRICRIPCEFELDAWGTWAKANGIPDVVIAFAFFRPKLLDSFDAKQDINCTARTLTKAAPVLVDTPKEVAFPIVRGLIGEGPAAELFGFQEPWLTVPSLDAVIKKGDILSVPTEEQMKYATVSKLATEVDTDNFDKIMVYINRFPVENQVSFIKLSLQENQDLGTTESFGVWLADNQQYII